MFDALVKELEFKIEELQLANEERDVEIRDLNLRISELQEAIDQAISRAKDVEGIGEDIAYYLKKA